jgi:hypothetical protein
VSEKLTQSLFEEILRKIINETDELVRIRMFLARINLNIVKLNVSINKLNLISGTEYNIKSSELEKEIEFQEKLTKDFGDRLSKPQLPIKDEKNEK